MNVLRALFTLLALSLVSTTSLGAGAVPRVLLIAGEPSHGEGEHRFPAGCALLARALNDTALVRAVACTGWPDDATIAEADVILLYSGGLDRHVAAAHVDNLRRHAAVGKGLVVLHFALEAERGELADLLLDSLGGRFEVNWSVNPMWTLAQPILRSHEVTRGVAPFAVEDEWYYHLRFHPGIQPVLQAVPPPNTLGEDGPRSGNPAVRSAINAGQPQTLAWVFEQNGRRAFGFTGGHYHRNWADDNFRRLVLNGIVWTAHAVVPAQGLTSATPLIPHYATLDEAIARADATDVRRHLAADPTQLDRRGASNLAPLHQAILRNRTEIAQLLLEAGAAVDQTDRSRRTPLHLAVERGNAAIVTALLTRQARPNERDQLGWTPLHHAAAKDRLEIARILLQGGADPMTLSEGGGTPLHEAAASGSATMVRLLLDAGVDPQVVSKTGVTALEIAREFQNEAALEVLSATADRPR